MANTIKFKRASGSDPSASDLAIGEPGLRTDTAELFFKKDDGTVAKVSGGGGGPNFKYLELRNAANNGAASFPGNDFTLVTAGTTTAISPSAANTLLVSVSGVIQKPNAGTSTSGITGFIIDGSRFKTATNLPAAPDFIVFQESGGIGEPSDNTVTSAKIVDGAIVNADINASAAIAGTKIDPDFGSQNIVTTGHLLVNTSSVGGGSYDQLSVAGGIKITDDSNSKLEIGRFNSSSATNSYIKIGSNSDSLRITNAADSADLFTLTNAGNLGLGTTGPVNNSGYGGITLNGGNGAIFSFKDSDVEKTRLALVLNDAFSVQYPPGNNGHFRIDQLTADGSGNITGATERMRIDSSGNVGIGISSPTFTSGGGLHIRGPNGGQTRLHLTTSNSGDTTQDGFYIIALGAESGGAAGDISMMNKENRPMRFGTNNTDRMRITAGGNVEITNLCVAGAGFAQFDNAQHLISTSSTGSSSSTYFIGNQAIQTSSDRRIKENIVDTKIDASSELKKVRVVDFTWNDPNDKAINNRNSRGKWTGCIAQEIVDVFPFAVNAPRPEGEEIDHDSEALWGMEYGQLVPVLIKGFQEAIACIETLETKVAALEAK